MTKRKLKPFVVPALYGVCVIAFVFSAYMIQLIIGKSTLKDEALDKKNSNYVDGEIINSNDQIPVINNGTVILRPYTASDVKIAKSFYDYKAEADKQKEAIIYYENTYMQNSGVDYKNDSSFDVVSILDGEVSSVKNDEILGTVVEIKHSNDIISVYQSLTDVSVKENDKLLAGQIIGKSGESNINKDMGKHLHFELYYKGALVNPEEYFDKNIEDL